MSSIHLSQTLEILKTHPEASDFRKVHPTHHKLNNEDLNSLKLLSTIEGVETYVKNKSQTDRIFSLPQRLSHESLHKVDQYFILEAPSNAWRQAMQQHWKGQRASHLTNGILAGAAAILIEKNFINLRPFISDTFIKILTVAVCIFTLLSVWRIMQASYQIMGWKNLFTVETFAADRKRAYEQGFMFVYQHNWKYDADPGRFPTHYAVLLPPEVDYLFKKYAQNQEAKTLLKQAKRCQTIERKKQWINSFNQLFPQEILSYVGRATPLKPANQKLKKHINEMAALNFDSAHKFLQELQVS